MPQYNTGETVQYKPVGGPTSHTPQSTGIITDVLTEPGTQAHRNVNASEDNPRYEIKNSNTRKSTTVYEKNILGMA